MHRKYHPPTMTPIDSSERRGAVFPEDLLTEIMIWLPVVSLLRFKSVSKSWFSLISSSHFISRHLRLNNSKTNPENRLVVLKTRRSDSGYYTNTANFISVNDPHHSNYAVLLPSIDGVQNCCSLLVGCFNGIVCFRYRDFVGQRRSELFEMVFLWNPATKQLRTLPPPQYENEVTQVHYGFGFDPQTSDYKLVRILLPIFLHENKLVPSRAEVYSLSRDSWRIINAVLPLHLKIVSNPNMPFQDDNYLWVAYGGNYSIISFNFSSETFGNIPLPEVLAEAENTLDLAFLAEKIACISFEFTSQTSHDYTIWVLDDNWVKMYTFSLDNVWPTMVSFSMDGRIILQKHPTISSNDRFSFDPLTSLIDGVLFVYDPHSKEMKEAPTQGGCFCQIAQYKESLVSVKSQNGI